MECLFSKESRAKCEVLLNSTNHLKVSGAGGHLSGQEDGHEDQAKKQPALQALEASHHIQESQDLGRSTDTGIASGGPLSEEKHQESRTDPRYKDMGECMKCKDRKAAVHCICEKLQLCRSCSQTCRYCGIKV